MGSSKTVLGVGVAEEFKQQLAEEQAGQADAGDAQAGQADAGDAQAGQADAGDAQEAGSGSRPTPNTSAPEHLDDGVGDELAEPVRGGLRTMPIDTAGIGLDELLSQRPPPKRRTAPGDGGTPADGLSADSDAAGPSDTRKGRRASLPTGRVEPVVMVDVSLKPSSGVILLWIAVGIVAVVAGVLLIFF